MTIQELANTVIRGEKAITFPLEIHDGWVCDQYSHHILDIRGWGFIQYMGKGAEEFQDAIGKWVVDTLNKAYEESSQPKQ